MTSKNKRFVALPFELCRRTDLTPTDKLVLGRIASFDVYFESTLACAILFGVAEQTVLKSKQKLEKKGLIVCLENDGRGKKYKVVDDWQTISPDATKKERPVPKSSRRNFSPLRPSVSKPVVKNEWNRWKEKNKDLVPILDAATNYLLRHKIPLTDPKALRKSISIVANLYRDPQEPEAHVYILQTYLAYLESQEYLYQLEHTKYCPNITTQYDLFGKFQAIREFKHDTRRHYDPTKTLTPQ